MKILIAEDETVSRILLQKILEKWDYKTLLAEDGEKAWELFQSHDVKFVISDWMMPRMDGLELCRRIRASKKVDYTYIILLTARTGKSSLVEGMKAGADDFVTKPFDQDELNVRILAGQRILEMQAHIKQLQGIIPICMHCHNIRDDQDAWQKIEKYIEEHSEAQFSHSLCPDCMAAHFPEVLQEKKNPQE